MDWHSGAKPPTFAGSWKMRTLIAGVLVLAFLTPAHAESLLRCHAKDAVDLEEDGTLQRNAVALSAMNDIWIIDLSTGVVRIGGGVNSLGPTHYTIVQEGNARNDHVLVHLVDRAGLGTNQWHKFDLSDAATRFIRIRQWSNENQEKPGIRFIRYDLSTLVSGTCEPIN
jgi:hypothetical protein